MRRTLFVIAAFAALAVGAEDPWTKVRDLKIGAELRIIKAGAPAPVMASYVRTESKTSVPSDGSGAGKKVPGAAPTSSYSTGVAISDKLTNNGSRAIAVGGKLYLKEDKYRVFAGMAKANINFDVYGIGSSAGKGGVFIPLNVKGGCGMGEFLHRVKKNIYVGARGQYRNARLSLNQDWLESDDITHQPPEEVAKVTAQIGDQLLKQTRYPWGRVFSGIPVTASSTRRAASSPKWPAIFSPRASAVSGAISITRPASTSTRS